MNIELASRLVARLYSLGVREFVICAGARNAPLVKILNATPELQTHHFFDERAAGFFAMGRTRAFGVPVAVVTTSGTAVAELFPSVVESYYSGVPVVYVTADRPQTYRGTGAPQAIDQVRIFSNYASFLDIAEASALSAVKLSPSGPTHINICFQEPLIDAEVKPVQLPVYIEKAGAMAHAMQPAGTELNEAIAFLRKYDRPLVIVGGLDVTSRGIVYEWLRQSQRPMILEATSGLRECAELAKFRLRTGAAALEKLSFRDHFDSVIRLGSVPTLRLWRDFEDKFGDVPVLAVDALGFSGLARKAGVSNVSLAALLAAKTELGKNFRSGEASLWQRDRELYASLELLLTTHVAAEPTVIRWLSEQIPACSHVMLGNSLPIREWDLSACAIDKNFVISANRGANGIDGLVATFLGGADRINESWLVLGDLSALYDLSALAFAQAAHSPRLRVVVVNNQGGQIFKSMFHDKNFINAHTLSFQKWAEMFGWNYKLVTPDAVLRLSAGPTVVELRPDGLATDQFDKKWREVLLQ